MNTQMSKGREIKVKYANYLQVKTFCLFHRFVDIQKEIIIKMINKY